MNNKKMSSATTRTVRNGLERSHVEYIKFLENIAF